MLPISVKYLCALFEKIYDEANYYRHLKYRGGCTIPLFQLNVWCEKCFAARHYAVKWKQLLFANKRNRVRWVVLGLSQYGACTDLSENFSEDSLKVDLSNDNIVSPPLFSLVNTLIWQRHRRMNKQISSRNPVTLPLLSNFNNCLCLYEGPFVSWRQ